MSKESLLKHLLEKHYMWATEKRNPQIKPRFALAEVRRFGLGRLIRIHRKSHRLYHKDAYIKVDHQHTWIKDE